VLDIDPKNAKAYIAKFLIYYNQHKDDEALIALDKALELNPSDPIAWRDKGIFLIDTGNKEAAIGCFKEAIQQVSL
jgi:tetratricopeptide (TPR) repeat protein